MIPCPSCGKHIDALANSCPNCGRPKPISKEMVDAEFKRVQREWKRSVNFKSEEEINQLYREARSFVLVGKFLLALHKIKLARGSNYERKSNEQCESELKSISEELNMSQEFILWKKRYDRNSILIFVIFIIIVIVLTILQKK